MRQGVLLAAVVTLLITGPTVPLHAARDAGIAAYEKSDYATALHELTPDAEAGDAEAQSYLGVLYVKGQGVKRDEAKAAFWFRKAAEQGNAEAQFYLGTLYSRGAGVPRDDAAAVSWLRKAAEAGHQFAQSSLAEMYLDGRGVERNLVQAYKWTVLAEPRPNPQQVPWNSFPVHRVARMMKPAEVARGQKLVKQWLRARR